MSVDTKRARELANELDADGVCIVPFDTLLDLTNKLADEVDRLAKVEEALSGQLDVNRRLQKRHEALLAAAKAVTGRTTREIVIEAIKDWMKKK